MYHPESGCVRKPTILPCEPVSPPDCGGESANRWVSQSTSWVCFLSWVHPRSWVNLSATRVCIPSWIPKRAKQTGNILQRSSVLSQLLTQRVPEVKYPQSKPKSSVRILTSSENLMLLEEKERKKEEGGRRKAKKEGGKRAKAIGTGGSKVQEETGEGV